MPLFKKTSVENGSLLEAHRRSLRQCQQAFLKDLDVLSVMDYIASEEGFRHDERDAILTLPTREQQITAFLDHLESRGERTFALFVEALKVRHKHLYAHLEDAIQTVDKWDACRNAEKTSVSGTFLRKLLLRRKRESGVQTGDDNENAADESELRDDCNDYIRCYSIATKGQLRKEKWITHVDSYRTDLAAAEEKSYMAVVSSNLIFRRLDRTVKLGAEVKRPPNNSIPTYVFEKEGDYAFSSASRQRDQDRADSSMLMHKKMREQMEEENELKSCIPAATIRVRSSVPPPVPPKPATLPVLGFGCGPPLPKPRKMSDVQDVLPPVRTTSKISLPNGEVRPPLPKNKPSLQMPLSQSANCALRTQKNFPLNLPLSSNCELKKGESENCKRLTLVETNLDDVDDDVVDDDDVDTVSLDYNISVGSTLEPEEDLQIGENEDSYAIDVVDDVKRDSPLENHLDINENMMKDAADEQPSNEDAEEQNLGVPVELLEKPTEGPLMHVETVNKLVEEEAVQILESHKLPLVSSCPELGDDRIHGMIQTEAASVQYDLPPTEDLTDECLSKTTSESIIGGKSHERQNSFPPSGSFDQPVFADDEFSSDNSYYEEIEQFCCGCSSPSCQSYNAYLDPRTSLLRKRSSVRSSRAAEESRKLGRKFLCRNSLLLVSCDDTAYVDRNDSSDIVEVKNELHQELDSSDFSDTLLCYDRDGSAFYVPSRFVKRYGDPEGEIWFYPVKISSREASLFLLSVKQEGCFVVYRPEGSSPNVAFNLSLCLANNDIVHYHIVENAHGDYGIEGHDHTFMTVGELVEYFRRNKSSLATRLRRPLRIASQPITPGYHYDICYELDRNDILLTGSIIGQGNFGVVCSGLYRNTSVAVKVLQQTDNLTAADEDDFIEEALAMMALRHDHIVCLIGVSCKTRPYFLVTEYMSQGNLKDCLRNGFILSDSIDILFGICIQIVSAMRYLENIRYMLHRDLAARNFLVNENLGVKLADFGRARIVSDDCYQASRTEKICIKWAAPEVLIYSRYSTKSDVWSFGVVLWEVFSAGARPFGIFSGEQTAMYVTEGGRLDKPRGCPSDLYEVMRSCWFEEPDDRPTFCELSQTFKSKSNIYASKSSMRRSHGDRLSSDVGKLSPVSVTEKNLPQGKSVSSSIFGTTSVRKTAFHDNKSGKSDANSENLVRCKSDARYILNHEGPASNYLSDLSIATGSSEIIDIDREDVSRGDRIRKSLRKLITKKSKTKFNELGGKPVPASRDYTRNYEKSYDNSDINSINFIKSV